jgi:hypothetical protein
MNVIEFVNNSAGVGGGGIIGSPQSLVRITGPSTLFQGNIAGKVCVCHVWCPFLQGLWMRHTVFVVSLQSTRLDLVFGSEVPHPLRHVSLLPSPTPPSSL